MFYHACFILSRRANRTTAASADVAGSNGASGGVDGGVDGTDGGDGAVTTITAKHTEPQSSEGALPVVSQKLIGPYGSRR